ncbi:hypothetical protein Mapa_006871 [Marchantia paleacea]|nr:hypothetical protein Mapa_006871 [Marchantia paleacea]
MSEYFKFLKRYSEAKSALLLTKCLNQRLWEDSIYKLKQLPGIGMVTAKAFLATGISSFDQLASSDPRHLEFITGRKFPFGDHIKSTLSLLPPKVQMKIQETKLHIGGKREFVLELTRLDSLSPHATNKWHMADLVSKGHVEDMRRNEDALIMKKIMRRQFTTLR